MTKFSVVSDVFLTEAPKPSAEQLAQIEKLREDARRSRDRAEESFQRCDTDGFLSQWANQIGAQKNDAQIRILENGGYARFRVLCDAEGNVVSTTLRTFWIDDNATWKGTRRAWDRGRDCEGRRWIPEGSKSRIQKQLGLHQEDRWFPASAEITTGRRKSTGLGGCANAYVATFRTDLAREFQE